MSNRRQFAVEVHPPDWHFPSGESWIAGWFYAGEHHFLTDIRAWIDGRVFLGLPGIPKPGLDEKFLGKAGPPYSGFIIRVEPHTGAKLLRLEERNPSGIWTEFFRTNISTDESSSTCSEPSPLASHLANLIPSVLRLRAQRPKTDWSILADEAISAVIAEPLNALPVPPFHGALEKPNDVGSLGYGRLAVTGWLAHRDEEIKRVTALVDAVQESPLLHGLPREDISEVFTGLPHHQNFHFSGHVDLPGNQSAPALIKVFAELQNGEKHLVFAKRFTPHLIAGTDQSFPHLSRTTFAAALWSLHQASRRHAMPLGNRDEIVQKIKSAWGEYRAEAPARLHKLRELPSLKSGSKPSGPLRVVIATHNLNFEGAPWFIYELARHLSKQPDVIVSIISPKHGPLGKVFQKNGMDVQVLDLDSTLKATSPKQFSDRLKLASSTIDWNQTDLVIANTMVTFWAIHAARNAGKPSLLYVHESSTIRRFFGSILHASLFPLIEETFKITSRVVFTANSTRQVFDYLNTRGNFALLPSWVDIDRIDEFVAATDKTSLRRKHGLDPEAVLLVNIGSVCERKGQHIFISAIKLLTEELSLTYPDRKIHFVMVGARPGIYLDSLKQELTLQGIDNTFALPESGEIYDFYRLADVFVCTSFEESFPRVLLESAAFRLPIVTTNVNGISEMLGDDEAWVIPPGDRYQLGNAIKQALKAHFENDTSRAENARRTIVHRYDVTHTMPFHTALAYEAVAEPSH